MNDVPALVSASCWTSRSEPGLISHRRDSLAALRSLIATWKARIGFRRDLEQMSRDGPHLIEDFGLGGRKAEAEIAKPFRRP